MISKMPFHDWEKTPNFDPAKISVNSPRWVNYKGSLLTEAQEMADNAHISQDFISVIAGEAFADASLLAFRDSSSFRAGELHRHMINGTSYFNRLITISLKYWTEFLTLSTLTSFLPIIKEAIRESIITAKDRLLAFLLIILLVRRLPSVFLILLSRD
ncbi:unnamed protein product [Porites lobata]|uniref:Uncharacterized protein n=1 Tax=Porites lobata TaxID=104759 RepID=A0ABN8NNK4_9CNID|nr:unnamed protein product [Porites lobata]